MLEQINGSSIPKKYFFIIIGFALINVLLIIFFLVPYTTPFASDSSEYAQTATYFRGETLPALDRLIKPVIPFFVAIGSYFFGVKPSFLLINGIFYLFIGLLVYKIIKLLFNNDRQALVGSLLFITAYPILEYGVTYMTDIGGWFFFIASIYLTLRFLKTPSYRLAILNGFTAALGFLTKEYIVGAILFFIVCVLFIFKEKLAQKTKYLLVYVLSFFVFFVPWQVFVYIRFHYSYYDWWHFNHVDTSKFSASPLRQIIKSVGATFMLGWALVFIGIAKLGKMAQENKKIIVALLIPSFSFLTWPTASSRLFYVIGLLLSILASWGIVSLDLFKKRFLLYGTLILVVAGNYFWFIFDDRIRFLIDRVFNIKY